jgi:octaprenyl-diphosphate synthase
LLYSDDVSSALSTERPRVADPFELIREDLARVETEFLRDTVSNVPAITEIGQYLQQSGGKRVRPALVLLTSRLVGCDGDSVLRLAAVVEMIHTATLIHDDIIDDAETRRGRPSTNSRWGNHMCVLAGDWLYMQAFNVALRERHFGVLDALISLTQTMVEGEMMQLHTASSVVTAEQHRGLINRKTASLFSVSCKLGALAAGRDEATINRLAQYGYHLGMAFQMIDDILDFTSSAAKLGKPVGNDLREGKMTLPAIYAHEQASTAEQRMIEAVMRERGYVSVSFDEVMGIIRRCRGIERARAEAETHARTAQDLICQFESSPYRDALEVLTAMVVEREN